ncbi:trigger factor [Humitalea sp. 24SJ18S-53]|uniref:trigger factor n=1 Tax=Humitalea sp. 24SJ18S-53 TaxID=3422307 RepID=UPI003D67F0BA
MQVTEFANEGLKRGYNIVVSAAEISAGRDKRLAALGRDLRLPGFRPGKVPASVVKQRYGAAIMSEVLEEQVGEATRKVVSDRGLRPALQPKVDVVNFADGGDLEFKVELELLPEIPLPDFSAIALERPKASPSPAEIDTAIEGIAGRNRTMVDVEEVRPATKGDVLVCDFVGRLAGETEPFQGGSMNDMPIEVAGEGFIPGFTEQLDGLSPGESRQITVSFPAEYGAAELAGKEAVFDITAKKLQRSETPVIDDAFAKTLGLDDLDAVKKVLTEGLQREYDGLARQKIKRALLDALSEQAQFEVPEGMIEGEFAQIWQRVEADMKEGRLDADDKGKDEDTLKAEYRAIAMRRIRLGLLLAEIGRVNGIQVTSEELGRAVRAEATRYPGQEKQVMDFFQKNPQAAENLRGPIFEDKVVDFMLELAKVTDVDVTVAELTAPPAAA